ncbi:phytanoyl-CoA hydroxylase-interacting protein-like [Mytilus trossulus]|uniref:phytanoyl-CoA hydroxylase-interacting protein-like n=1 Tax=Mytilus trossulus TaxID=6551 RepID=UPI003004926D
MALFKHLNLTVPKHFDFQRICDLKQFSDLEVTIQNSRDQVEELEACENTDFSKWELQCPENVDSLFIMVTSKDNTCIKVLDLDPNNKNLYLDLNTDQDTLPLTLMLIGLQTVTKGSQKYYVVRTEGYTEIKEEMSSMELNLTESKGSLCGSKLFDLADNKGAEIAVKHKLGSKYWIKTEPSSRKQTSKFIILQDKESEEVYFFFTENIWRFKSIPFLLKPCSQYRCMTYYGCTSSSQDHVLSFRCKSLSGVAFTKNYQLFRTSKIHTFTAYMTKTELQKLYNMGRKFVGRNNIMAPIRFFYRNKPREYFEDIFWKSNGIMRKYMKDNNGDRYSVINKNLEGLFFSALLESKTLKPPPTSIFGTRRMFVFAPKMLNLRSNVYFADFYCNFYIHYVTLVITEANSSADKYCRGRLLMVNQYDNPFIKLVLEHGEWSVFVTTNVHVELFYTENIDLNAIKYQQGGFLFEDVPVRGKGTSCPEGIAKKAGCKICNLEA